MGYEDGRPSQEAWEKAYREACSMPVACIRRKIEDEGPGHVFPPKPAHNLVKGAFLSASCSVQYEKEQFDDGYFEIRRPVTTLHEGSVDGMGKTTQGTITSRSQKHRLSTTASTGEFYLFSGFGRLLDSGCDQLNAHILGRCGTEGVGFSRKKRLIEKLVLSRPQTRASDAGTCLGLNNQLRRKTHVMLLWAARWLPAGEIPSDTQYTQILPQAGAEMLAKKEEMMLNAWPCALFFEPATLDRISILGFRDVQPGLIWRLLMRDFIETAFFQNMRRSTQRFREGKGWSSSQILPHQGSASCVFSVRLSNDSPCAVNSPYMPVSSNFTDRNFLQLKPSDAEKQPLGRIIRCDGQQALDFVEFTVASCKTIISHPPERHPSGNQYRRQPPALPQRTFAAFQRNPLLVMRARRANSQAKSRVPDPRDNTSLNSVDRLPELPISSRFPAPGLRYSLLCGFPNQDLLKAPPPEGSMGPFLTGEDILPAAPAILPPSVAAAATRPPAAEVKPQPGGRIAGAAGRISSPAVYCKMPTTLPPSPKTRWCRGNPPLPSSSVQFYPQFFVPFLAVDALEKGSSHCPRTPSQFPLQAQLPRVPRRARHISPRITKAKRQPVTDDTGRPIFTVVQTAIQLGQFRLWKLVKSAPNPSKKPKHRSKAQFFTFLLRRRLFNEVPCSRHVQL
ncbi:uncharacterized protein CLUP02_06583 [Colletotrichum lupini]|uniref:Uncharacterized protein n=1 Tax=Colletotrichum lupini TaxID=145971 RepID=A0A9Q8WFP2_9PEZI|nr:uncharacterized protein CLUP02_06583 [Colletotrichum lupini]UQC81097.1 hypothetical protein CLUP02_06583 [Colletotrichum lupini]